MSDTNCWQGAEGNGFTFLRRKIWTRAETKALLEAYGRHKVEFSYIGRKKYAWQSVAADISSVLGELIRPSMVESKIRNLFKAYEQAAVNGTPTGAVRTYELFQKEIGELIESRPTVAHSHSNSLPVRPIVAEPTQKSGSSDAPRKKEGKKKKLNATYEERKIALNADYYKKTLQLFEKANDDKEKRHKERMELLQRLTHIIPLLRSRNGKRNSFLR